MLDQTKDEIAHEYKHGSRAVVVNSSSFGSGCWEINLSAPSNVSACLTLRDISLSKDAEEEAEW
jgi:hypothetical protein